jgi:hypothetical protein
MPVIATLRRWRQEDHKANLSYNKQNIPSNNFINHDVTACWDTVSLARNPITKFKNAISEVCILKLLLVPISV